MTTSAPVKNGVFALPEVVYDVVKDAALIWLPAVAVFYASVAGIWHLPNPNEIVATIVSIDTFLGVVLKVSTVSYNNSDKSKDGTLIVDQSDPQADKYLLDVTTPLADVADAKTITLKVDNQTPNGAVYASGK